MSFRRFFVVRLAWALLGIWFVVTLVFAVFYIGVEDPARSRCGGDQASPACIEFMRKELHLDAPLPERYVRFVWRLLADRSPGPATSAVQKGFPSDSGRLAREALPATLSVVIPALLLAVAVAGLSGIALSRVRRRRTFEFPIYVAFGLSPVVLGIWLSYYLGVRWDVTPIANYCDFFSPAKDSGCGGSRLGDTPDAPRDHAVPLLRGRLHTCR